jgi:pseudouridine kinase
MNDRIVGIGAANLDVHGRSRAPINLHDSNPGTMSFSAGGVTRNILENYCRLGGTAVLLTAVGNDPFGERILSASAACGIDVSHVLVSDQAASSTYMSLLDSDGEMAVALSDMSVLEQLTPGYLDENAELLSSAALIVTDPSIPAAVMDHLLERWGRKIPVCVDPVSVAYAHCVKDKIGQFWLAKPNRLEAEALSGMAITDRASLEKAAAGLIDKGLRALYVSCGPLGCYYTDKDGIQLTCRLPEARTMANATGAGDAFMAMALYGLIHRWDKEKTLRYACGAGMAAVQSAATIHPQMSLALIESVLAEAEKR